MSNWKVVKGILLDTWIDYETTQGEVVTAETFRRKVNSKYLDVKVVFGFRINEEIYVSDLINFDRNEDRVDYYLQKYPVGQEVKVFYERGNPDFAVLEPDIWSFHALQSFITCLIFLCGYLFLWLLCPKFKWCVRSMERFYKFWG